MLGLCTHHWLTVSVCSKYSRIKRFKKFKFTEHILHHRARPMQKLLLVRLWFCTHHWLTETEKDKFPSSRTTYYVILQERSCKSGCWLDCDFALIIDCLKLRNARITSYGNGAHITSYCKSGRVRRIVQTRCNSCLDCDHWSWTPSKNLTGQTLSKFTEYIRLHVRPVQQLLNCETLYIYRLGIQNLHFPLFILCCSQFTRFQTV